MEYVKRVYSGRIGRRSYILGYLLLGLFLVVAVMLLITLALMSSFISSYVPKIALVIYVLLILTHQFYGVSLYVRRLHDLNKSGWYALWFLVPLVNIYWALVLLFRKGEEGENKYGILDKDAKLIKTIFKLV